VRNLSIKIYRIYVCYTNITLYHVIYSVRCYPRFHVTAVGLGTFYPVDMGIRLCILMYASVIKNFVIKIEGAGVFFFRNIGSNYLATCSHTPEDRNPQLCRSKSVINKRRN
jgi:hypothetical protein